MSHILFLSDKQRVCEWPEKVGEDFVIIDYLDGIPCKECTALLTAHNVKEAKYDMVLNLPRYFPVHEDKHFVRGFLHALPFALGFWLGVFFLLKWAF